LPERIRHLPGAVCGLDSPRHNNMSRKFLIACLIAMAIGTAAGFAMPADADAPATQQTSP